MIRKSDSTMKKNLWMTLVLFTIFALLASLQLLTGEYAERELIKSAQAVLKNWNAKTPTIGEKIRTPNGGWGMVHTFALKGKNPKGALVYIVSLTGNAGPYTGIFYRDNQRGTIFCGLAGIPDPDKPASFYGITDRILVHWIRKIDRLGRMPGDTND